MAEHLVDDTFFALVFLAEAVERLAAIGSLAQLLARERKFVLLLQQLLQLGEGDIA
mgnify:CR=1 FL=1